LKKKKKERINTEEMEDPVKRLKNAGHTLGQISQELSISKSSVQNIANKIDKREKLGELRRKEEELREKERRLVQKKRETEEKKRRSDEEIAKRSRDAELELKKTKGKKEEYEGRIGEIKKREKEANKIFDQLRELDLTLQNVVNVAHNYNSYNEKIENLKKGIPSLREEYEKNKKSRDEMRSEHLKAQKELDSIQKEIFLMEKKNHSLSSTVISSRGQQNALTYQVARLENRSKCLDKSYAEEFERKNFNLESIKSEIERENFRLDEIKNDYETTKKNQDDLLSLGKSKIREKLEAYKDAELSKIEKDLEAKKIKSKEWDQIISSKKEESDALIERIKDLMDGYLALREKILWNIDRCDSVEDRKEFEEVLNDLNKVLVNIIGSKQKQPATLMGAKARGVVYDVVADALRKKGIAIPEI